MNLDDLKNLIKGGVFNSPTKGALALDKVVIELINFKKEKPEDEYRIVIGTDSEKRERGAEFVCVVAIHRVGKGGRYFWLRLYDDRNFELRSRIYQEATISLALAGALLEKELEMRDIKLDMQQQIVDVVKTLEKNGKNLDDEIIFSNELEIHVDIGTKGPTREMIKEIVGMIKGSGFPVRIKPDSFAASTLADKHL